MKVAAPGQGQEGPLGPIQLIPPGLLGLLQLKQLGRLPDKLADTVAGVVELRDWYLTARRVDQTTLFGNATLVTAALGAGNTGFQAFHVGAAGGPVCIVPQNQLWWVEQLTIAASLVAADVIRVLPAVTSISGIGFGVAVDYNDVTTARARQLSCSIPRGFWAYPGDTFGVAVMDITSVPGITLSMGLRATPCPI